MKQLAISVMPQEDSSDTDHTSVHSSSTNESIVEQESTETQSSWSTDEEKADMTEILMEDQPSTSQPPVSSGPTVSEAESDTEQTNPSPEQTAVPPGPPKTTSNGPFFTIDDVPYPLRYKCINEFRAWANSQLSKGVFLRQALTEFCSRMIDSLSDWFTSLGTYEQLQLMQMSYDNFFRCLYREFVGDLGLLQKHFKSEFFKMKCCSLVPKDIDRHIERMTKHFYLLNGINDPSLKHVFFASFPEELQHDMEKLIDSTKRSFESFGLGELSHIVKEASKLLCEKHAATERFFKQKQTLKKACRTNYEIGCPKTDCACKPFSTRKKKTHSFEISIPRKRPSK
jgi:hypothetical protein